MFNLPVGPIWFLHVFNLVCTLLMLSWHVRYAGHAEQEPDEVQHPESQGRQAPETVLSPGEVISPHVVPNNSRNLQHEPTQQITFAQVRGPIR